MKLTFRGRTALILGGSSAIGLELAARLLDEGLRPIPAHSSADGLSAIAERFPDLAATSPRVDLADRASLDALRPALDAGIDYLIDLAHSDREGLLAATGDEAADEYFEAHVAARVQLIKAVTRSMLARRFGRLLHVSSTAAALPAPGQGLYCAAKRAAEGLYQTLGLELAERGVTAMNLRLGLVDAGRGARFLDREDRRRNLAGRIVTLDQAAGTALYLLSDQALALTCTTITMDAGLTARKYA